MALWSCFLIRDQAQFFLLILCSAQPWKGLGTQYAHSFCVLGDCGCA